MKCRRPPVNAQLELFTLEEGGYVRVPWGGRSPRGLTRVALGLILKAQAAKSVSELISPSQLEFDLDGKKASPGFAGGAPLLVEPGGPDE